MTRGQRAVLDKITSGTHARRPTTRTASRAPSTVESEIPDDDNESVSSKASKSTTTSKGPGKRTRASSTESVSTATINILIVILFQLSFLNTEI